MANKSYYSKKHYLIDLAMKNILHKMTSVLSFRWCTGPIFNKELRVSSRKKRSYLMRSLYLFLLMLFISLVWFEATRSWNSMSFQTTRMAEASKEITCFIVWFQFIAIQILAVILCSTAINQEIFYRTLPILMTTPVSSLQIVMGKLLSRLWQIFLLLGISLPLLAMIRVFGGIPWLFLLISLTITLTLTLFISALTIFFSILFRRAYAVIIVTVIALALIYVLAPFALFLIGEALDSVSYGPIWIDFDDIAEETVIITNPYILMVETTDDLLFFSSGQFPIRWLIQSAILLLSASSILVISCVLVRKTALKHLVPKKNRKKYKIPPRKSKTYWLRRPIFLHSMIQRTIGTGMIWKEFLHPVLGKFRKIVFIGLILMIAAFIISVLSVLALGEVFLFSAVIACSVIGVIALAILFTIIIPATYITSEKESGTWLILLTTCYSDIQILGGKIIGILRRILIVWSPVLLIYYVAAYVADYPTSIFFKLMLALVTAIGFVIASGLYFSSRFKHSTTAVICNLALAAVLWLGIPGLLIMIEEFVYMPSGPFAFIYHYADDFIRIYWPLTPPGMIGAILDEQYDSYLYRPWSFSTFLITYTISHLLAILFFLWRTKANLRKRIT